MCKNGHQSLRHHSYQAIGRGCHIHVVSTTWLGHPRLNNRADRSGGFVSPVTAAQRNAATPGGKAGARESSRIFEEFSRLCIVAMTVVLASVTCGSFIEL